MILQLTLLIQLLSTSQASMVPVLQTKFVFCEQKSDTYCLPKELKPYLNKVTPYSGPNCFSTSLYVLRYNQTLRSVTDSEIKALLNSSYCKVSPTPSPYTVGAFHSEGHYVHSFVPITNKLVINKNGEDSFGYTFPFQILLRDDVVYAWEADAFCRRYGDKTCFNQLTYYRCNFRQLTADFSKSIQRAHQEIAATLQSIQTQGRIMGSLEAPNLTDLQKLTSLIAMHAKLSKQETNRERRNLLRERNKSYQDQLKRFLLFRPN